jgi:hypothetical protein
MGFFASARAAAAAEYGRVRAEKYGRRAKFGRFLAVLAIVALVFLIGMSIGGGLGG